MDDVILELWTVSGKQYRILPAREGIEQYGDRGYHMGPLPDFLDGQLFLRTCGNDKMHEDDESCIRFRLGSAATVYVLHGNTFPARPAWLQEFEDTGIDVRRPIEDDARNMSFSVFKRVYPAGAEVTLGGDLPKGFLTSEFLLSGGAGFCMYSVIVAPC